jgi:hypothetical protein
MAVASSLTQPREYSFTETPKVIIAWFGDPSGAVLPVGPRLSQLIAEAELSLDHVRDDFLSGTAAESDAPPPKSGRARSKTAGLGSSLPRAEHPVDPHAEASMVTWEGLWEEVVPPATWAAILSLEPQITRWPVFTGDPRTLARLVARGELIDAEYRSVQPTPTIARLVRYTAFAFDRGTEAFSTLRCLRSLEGVGHAYLASGVEVPLPTASGAYVSKVSEIKELPQLGTDGLDVAEPPAVAPIGVRFADVEYDWNPSHEAFESQKPTLRTAKSWSAVEGDWPNDRQNRTTPYFSPKDYWSHGTAAIGTVVGRKLNYRGVAPGAPTFLSPVIPPSPPGAYANIFVPISFAIHEAVSKLCVDPPILANLGGVLLIEMQTQRDGLGPYRPCEFEPVIWEAIRLACANGVTVIEPAGNGGIKLSSAVGGVPKGFKGWPNDSNAIVVGAVVAGTRVRWVKSNYGHRVDCCGWSDGVVASACDDLGPVQNPPDPYPTAKDNTSYYGDFSGTSAASAMIAGAAVVVQQFARTKFGGQIPPRLLRALLSSPTIGVDAVFGTGPGLVGVKPNLAALENLSKKDLLEVLRDAWTRTPHMSPPTLPAGAILDQVAGLAWAAYGQP